MRRVSAYLTAMAQGISDDVSRHVAPDKLQFEVEKELQEQMLAQLVGAVSEYKQAVAYYRTDEVKCNSAKNKVLRHMSYVTEMWTVTNEVKGALERGGQPDEVPYEVVSDAF